MTGRGLEPGLSDLQRLGSGREAEVFAWDEATVLKLALDPSAGPAMGLEYAAQAAAAAAGAPVPAVKGEVMVGGRPGILMERIDGPDLLSELEKKPWRLVRIGREMAEVHVRLNHGAAPPSLPGLAERVRHSLKSTLIPADIAQSALETLSTLPDGDRLCHGDFHPANLIRGPRGLAAIDFSNACAGDPDMDFATTLTILRLGEPPPGAPWWIRRVTGVARRVLLRAYGRRYRELRGVNEVHVAGWTRVFLAQRLSHGILEERERILRQLN